MSANGSTVWPGVIGRSLLLDSHFQIGNYFADAAAKGNWPKVLEILDSGTHLVDINQSRPGDSSWTTVLHEAATGNSSPDILAGLVDRGALRSLPDAAGRIPLEVALTHQLPGTMRRPLLPPPSPIDAGRVESLNAGLTAVADDLIEPFFPKQNLRKIFRYPPVEILDEVPGQQLWFEVPKMMGGFRVMLRRGYLALLAGYRGVFPVTALEFVITHETTVLVHEQTPKGKDAAR